MTWRKNLDPVLKRHVEKLIKESFLYRKDYKKAGDLSKAQLWIALATLSKKIQELEDKIGPSLKESRKKDEEEVEKILREFIPKSKKKLKKPEKEKKKKQKKKLR